MRRLPSPVLLLALALGACRPGAGGDLASPDPARRAAAVSRLTDRRDPEELAALLVAQQDGHPAVRAAAAQALGARGGLRPLEALASMLSDRDPEVAVAAARALAGIRPDGPPGDAAAAARLSEAAARALAQAYGRADTRARVEIADALRTLGAPLRAAVEAEARLLWEQNVRALNGPSAAGRAGAAEELGRSGRTDALRLLLPLLEAAATGPEIAAAAARGLGGSGDPAAFAPLEAAVTSPSAIVVESAAQALGALGDPQAAEPLADLGTSASSRLALVAVAALDALPQAPGVGIALCEVALRARDPAVAGAAASGASDRAADCPERPIVQRLARGGPDAVAALSALGSLRLQPDRLKAPAEKAVGLLGSSTEAKVRGAAAHALGEAGYAPAVPALQRRRSAIQERAERGKGAAAGGGAPIADPADVEELVEVAVALAHLAPEGSGPLTARLAAAADPRLRAAAARSIALAGKYAAQELVVRLSADEDGAVRLAAYDALATRGEDGVAPLAAALRAHAADPTEADAVVRALGETRDAAAVPVLAPLLAGSLAPQAARSLGRLGVPASVPPLLGALKGNGAAGRLEVVEALASLGAPEAGDPLTLELLADRPAVRAAAARALGKIRHEPATGRLEALRADYYADVRRAALEALARMPARAPRRP